MRAALNINLLHSQQETPTILLQHSLESLHYLLIQSGCLFLFFFLILISLFQNHSFLMFSKLVFFKICLFLANFIV